MALQVRPAAAQHSYACLDISGGLVPVCMGLVPHGAPLR